MRSWTTARQLQPRTMGRGGPCRRVRAAEAWTFEGRDSVVGCGGANRRLMESRAGAAAPLAGLATRSAKTTHRGGGDCHPGEHRRSLKAWRKRAIAGLPGLDLRKGLGGATDRLPSFTAATAAAGCWSMWKAFQTRRIT